MCEQRIDERKESIDGIRWWPAIAAVKPQFGIWYLDKVIEGTEVSLCRLSFMATQQIDCLIIHEYRPDEFQATMSMCKCCTGGSSEFIAMIAQTSTEDCSLIMEFASENIAHDAGAMRWVVSRAILLTAQ